MPELPDGTLTAFHTDIENSTSLTRHLRKQYPAVRATPNPATGRIYRA